jgi:hypothetical protein
MNNEVIPVDEHTRRLNYLAIQKRDKWRAKYQTITTLIISAKSLVNEQPCNPHLKYILRTLQKEARILMEHRSYITIALKRTAYKWI